MGDRAVGESVICPICQFDLFEGIDFDKKDQTDIEAYTQSQLSGGKALDEVVLMKKCKDHQFHAECLESQLGDKSDITCCICKITYGI